METGKYYYYAKEKQRFKCTKVGDIQSVFIGEDSSEYQFYNEDMYKKKFMNKNMTENKRCEYVPSIPLPYYGIKKKCECGEKFWTEKGYRAHYALEHILGLE